MAFNFVRRLFAVMMGFCATVMGLIIAGFW